MEHTVLEKICTNTYTLAARHKERSFVWSILPGFLYCRSCSNIL